MAEASGLVLDDRNANKGTERGLGALEHSLRTFGAGRSGLADKDGRMIAGNKTVQRAIEMGIPIKVIETDGRQLVVLKRTDIDLNTAEGRGLAIADNRVAELDLEWDPDVLAGLKGAGVDLDAFWFPEELQTLLDQANFAPTDPGGQSEIDKQTRFVVALDFEKKDRMAEYNDLVERLKTATETTNPVDVVLAALRDHVEEQEHTE